MAKLTFTLLFTILTSLNLWASDNDYTYQYDKAFLNIHEIDGYTFRPYMYQHNNEWMYVGSDSIKILIKGNQLKIQGIEGLADQTVMASYPAHYNFIYDVLVDEKTQVMARWRLITERHHYVRYLYLQIGELSNNDFYIFYLPRKEGGHLAQEKIQYTDKNRYFVRSYINLINKEIKPFAKGAYQVVEVEDSLNIQFGEYDIVLNEKGQNPHKYRIQRAKTFAYQSVEFPSTRSRIEVYLKEKKAPILIFLNYKQQIECIEIEGSRYFLHS